MYIYSNYIYYYICLIFSHPHDGEIPPVDLPGTRLARTWRSGGQKDLSPSPLSSILRRDRLGRTGDATMGNVLCR